MEKILVFNKVMKYAYPLFKQTLILKNGPQQINSISKLDKPCLYYHI